MSTVGFREASRCRHENVSGIASRYIREVFFTECRTIGSVRDWDLCRDFDEVFFSVWLVGAAASDHSIYQILSLVVAGHRDAYD